MSCQTVAHNIDSYVEKVFVSWDLTSTALCSVQLLLLSAEPLLQHLFWFQSLWCYDSQRSSSISIPREYWIGWLLRPDNCGNQLKQVKRRFCTEFVSSPKSLHSLLINILFCFLQFVISSNALMHVSINCLLTILPDLPCFSICWAYSVNE